LQILCADHWLLVASYIHTLIDANDAALAAPTAEIEEEQEQESDCHQNRSPLSFPNIYLGSPQKPCSLDNLQEIHSSESAFKNFTKRLQGFLSAQRDAGKDVAQKIHSLTQVWLILFISAALILISACSYRSQSTGSQRCFMNQG